MERIKISLSVFYDGQFFTALFECSDENGYSVAKKVFASAPSDMEIRRFILDDFYSLPFSKPVRSIDNITADRIMNPKRMQREAAKALNNVGFSTKAQEAIKLQHEEIKEMKTTRYTRDSKKEEDMQYELRVQKRKQKHRGR